MKEKISCKIKSLHLHILKRKLVFLRVGFKEEIKGYLVINLILVENGVLLGKYFH